MMEFGELNITASRAFWDDYENADVDQKVESIEVQWKWTKNCSIENYKNVKTFIILEGERIRRQITQSNDSNIVPICQLSHQKVFISLLKNERTAICLSEESNLNTFGVVAEAIAELINSCVPDVNVVTVKVLPISSYKIGVGETLNGDIVIRGISMDAGSTISELLEPNIFTGITAAVASHRHHLRKPFSSYVIYKDSHKTNFMDTPTVLQFFETIGISSNIFYENYLGEPSLYT